MFPEVTQDYLLAQPGELMLDFSNESIKTSPSSVLSSLTFGLWVSSHLSNQSAKVGTAECAERSAAPRCSVLDSRSDGTCQFFFVSSSSCLHLQAFMPSTFCFNFCLQFFALFLTVLDDFFSLPSPPHRPDSSARSIVSEPFFCFFCVFLPSIVFLFFPLIFFFIFAHFEAAWGPQKQAKIGKILLRKKFFG